jgi:para-nitrobenzyl esterase
MNLTPRSAALVSLLFLACGRGRNGPPETDGGVPLPDAGEVAVSCPEGSALAVTEAGCVRGREESGAVVFRGIPFATPPVGPLRWTAPKPAARWSGEREAAGFSKACPQVNALISGETLDWDEDCLYLNVWTPAVAAEPRLPVMVWIHGGGLQNGAASQPTYDGRFFAGRGVVLVSVNYRLAQLGYLAHPALSAEQADGVSGNYGLLDQLRALEWVRDNVARFGGDPANVTVFGESAGGLSVCGLLATPGAAGLFHRAIIQSAVCPAPGSQFVRPLRAEGGQGGESAEAQGRRFSAALGCPAGAGELACMRAKPALEVLKTLQALSGYIGAGERYAFTVDGKVLPATPYEALAAGTQQHVPLILGTTGNEASIFTLELPVETQAKYEALVRAFYGAAADELLALYPASSYPYPKAALNALISDIGTVCGVRRAARAAVRSGVSAHLYQFTHVTAVAKPLGLGAFHSSELEFVFGTLRDRSSSPATAGELALSDAMAGYWVSFATSGEPNASAAVEWKPFTVAGDASLRLEIPLALQTGLRQQACDVADRLGLGG